MATTIVSKLELPVRYETEVLFKSISLKAFKKHIPIELEINDENDLLFSFVYVFPDSEWAT